MSSSSFSMSVFNISLGMFLSDIITTFRSCIFQNFPLRFIYAINTMHASPCLYMSSTCFLQLSFSHACSAVISSAVAFSHARPLIPFSHSRNKRPGLLKGKEFSSSLQKQLKRNRTPSLLTTLKLFSLIFSCFRSVPWRLPTLGTCVKLRA